MFGVLADLLMPYHPFTRLTIFNIFWSSPWQILKRAHHSSGNSGPTSSPLDHTIVSLSKQTDIVHSEGCQLDSCDIASAALDWRDRVNFPQLEIFWCCREARAFKNLGLPSFNSVAMEQRVRAWYRLPHVNKMNKACCVLWCRKVHSVCSNRARLKYC